MQGVLTRLPAAPLGYALPGLLVLGLVLVPAVIDRFLPLLKDMAVTAKPLLV